MRTHTNTHLQTAYNYLYSLWHIQSFSCTHTISTATTNKFSAQRKHIGHYAKYFYTSIYEYYYIVWYDIYCGCHIFQDYKTRFPARVSHFICSPAAKTTFSRALAQSYNQTHIVIIVFILAILLCLDGWREKKMKYTPNIFRSCSSFNLFWMENIGVDTHTHFY